MSIHRRLIRINLKLAINFGLDNRLTDLLASYFQLIIMIEGDKWIKDSSHLVALALRSGPVGLPVATATTIVEKWIGREIKKATQVAAVQEYVSNSVGDLIMLGLWSVVGDRDMEAAEDPIFPWLFARDDRIYRFVPLSPLIECVLML